MLSSKQLSQIQDYLKLTSFYPHLTTKNVIYMRIILLRTYIHVKTGHRLNKPFFFKLKTNVILYS